MSETVRKRRRWPWITLCLLLMAAPIACRYRPLNTAERRLVGEWETDGEVFQFRSDRTYTSRVVGDLRKGVMRHEHNGRWEATDSTLLLHPDFSLLDRLRRAWERQPASICWLTSSQSEDGFELRLVPESPEYLSVNRLR